MIFASCNGQNNQDVVTKDAIYKVINNDSLMLRVYFPDNFKKKKKYPTIVFFFGGGWNGGTITQFEDQSKYFASRGMVTAVVDYRVKSRNKTTPFDAVKDAKSAMRYLKIHAKDFGIDTKKMVASGGSAGGHLAAATTLLPGLNESTDDLSVSPKATALILFNPVIDNGEGGYGYERIGDRYMEISPMHNITKGAPPTIFFLGDNDKHIPVATGKEYKYRMEAVGSRCDLFIYEGQEHGFFNKSKKKGKYYYETVYEADLFLQSLGYLKGKATITKAEN
ncbi:alpha/beta hydrolase fold domain-containing protein [Algibacter wandonensis]|nr:alpha/beta hydrolase fold domain-containing protein [Algibacter lectus]